MATRRMFSSDIVGSDAFMEMPVSSQVLYFHLGIRADDDGFVNPQITMRMLGANQDDLKILIAKRFLLTFDNGVVVVKHWRINNFIRRDRYKPTNYTEQRDLLYVKQNMSYTLDSSQGTLLELAPWKSDFEVRSTRGQPLVRLGEDRVGKDRIGKEKNTHGEFNNVLLTTAEYKRLCDAVGEEATNSLIGEMSSYIESSRKKYHSHYAALQNWVRKRVKEHKALITKTKTRRVIL